MRSPLSLLTGAMMILLSVSTMANAGEIYKWKDEKGNVHFGDQRLAPTSSEKLDIPAPPPPVAPPAAQPFPAAAKTPLAEAEAADKKKQVVKDSAVPANCKALLDAVTNTPSGVDRRPATNAFIDACPGVAQVCREYRNNPEKNYCRWVRREEKDPIKRHTVSD